MSASALSVYFVYEYQFSDVYISEIDNIKYHTWPRTPHGKVTKTQQNVTCKRAKRLALSQQVTTRLQRTDKKARQTRNINNKNDPQKFYII